LSHVLGEGEKSSLDSFVDGLSYFEAFVMPELCRFYGIIIKIQSREHLPPHIHVWYAGHDSATIRIRDGTVLRGKLPKPQLSCVLAWIRLHQDELMDAWDLASRRMDPGKIDPLE